MARLADLRMPIHALRGATTVDNDLADEVKKRAGELVVGLLERNGLSADDVISILFTTTTDIKSVAPAAGVRELGIVDIPLLCAVEMEVQGSLPLCIRLMAHVETNKPRSELRHVFMRGATALRPDLVEADHALDNEGTS